MPRINRPHPELFNSPPDDHTPPLSVQWFEAILTGDAKKLKMFGLNQKQIAELRQLEHRTNAATKLLTRDNTSARSVSKRVVAAQNGILPVHQAKALSTRSQLPALGVFHSKVPAPVTVQVNGELL